MKFVLFIFLLIPTNLYPLHYEVSSNIPSPLVWGKTNYKVERGEKLYDFQGG